jgi:hypothetical protein
MPQKEPVSDIFPPAEDVLQDLQPSKKRLVETLEEPTDLDSGGVVNLTGTWLLDTNRSDRMDAYLSTMVCDIGHFPPLIMILSVGFNL